MALTVDQVFDEIGSFGRYQLLLLLGCNGLVFFWFGFPVLIMTFITPDPGWKCVANSSQCLFNETSLPPSDKRRCDLNRSEWVFTDDYTSVATEVRYMIESTFEPSGGPPSFFWSLVLLLLLSKWDTMIVRVPITHPRN